MKMGYGVVQVANTLFRALRHRLVIEDDLSYADPGPRLSVQRQAELHQIWSFSKRGRCFNGKQDLHAKSRSFLTQSDECPLCTYPKLFLAPRKEQSRYQPRGIFLLPFSSFHQPPSSQPLSPHPLPHWCSFIALIYNITVFQQCHLTIN